MKRPRNWDGNMKVIVAGSRDITDIGIVARAIGESGFKITEIVSGGARGVDYLGELLASMHGHQVKLFPADWDKHGKGAGPIRNRKMARYGDCLVAVWDGSSSGTANMIQEMKKLGKPVHVHVLDKT